MLNAFVVIHFALQLEKCAVHLSNGEMYRSQKKPVETYYIPHSCHKPSHLVIHINQKQGDVAKMVCLVTFYIPTYWHT